MRVCLSKSERSFSAAADRSVLDAALDAGLALAHSCRSGNCGSCRARLVRGAIAYPQGPPLGLSAAEIAAGYILLCQARAQSELEIEIQETRFADEAVIKRLPCRIERLELVAHDVMAVHLRRPAAEDFQFEPGQYVDVLLAGGRRRSFSIASPPHDSRFLELHVRRVDGGAFTERVFGAEACGALLEIEGPLGRFYYRPPEHSAAPLLLVGGGTGYAPLNSILRHLVDRGVEREMSLYWGVRAERDLYADAAIGHMLRRARRLRYVPVLSEPSAAWTGRRGLVHEAALQDCGRLEDFDIYASGPPAMIAAVRSEFGLRGARASRLFFDSFDYAADVLDRQRSSSASKS
ncbi:MAG TPA: 2Fe-2S iron-sulfur cluster-binding protein [Steroidobacteraceae bacterium]|nr:2Fe-2S iron-sulfur cluster-binding protein [Steroidobacteraceae bacterium]